MITQQQGRKFIRIPGVAELFPTPMSNLFSIEDGVLHYAGQEEDEEVEPEGEHPEEPDVEAEDPGEEAYVPPQYTTYQDLHDIGDHINDITILQPISITPLSILQTIFILGVMLCSLVIFNHHRNNLPCYKK